MRWSSGQGDSLQREVSGSIPDWAKYFFTIERKKKKGVPNKGAYLKAKLIEK